MAYVARARDVAVRIVVTDMQLTKLCAAQDSIHLPKERTLRELYSIIPVQPVISATIEWKLGIIESNLEFDESKADRLESRLDLIVSKANIVELKADNIELKANIF